MTRITKTMVALQSGNYSVAGKSPSGLRSELQTVNACIFAEDGMYTDWYQGLSESAKARVRSYCASIARELCRFDKDSGVESR